MNADHENTNSGSWPSDNPDGKKLDEFSETKICKHQYLS